uniref:Uncharacterized protein n=1 Tax=Arundo donax TaxID=35708 RepID=A0A0A9GQ39_ARUDO
MSAQETVPGHLFSSFSLMLSMMSNASRVRFGLASFSALFPRVELMSTDPSQPLTKQSWK